MQSDTVIAAAVGAALAAVGAVIAAFITRKPGLQMAIEAHMKTLLDSYQKRIEELTESYETRIGELTEAYEHRIAELTTEIQCLRREVAQLQGLTR